MNSLTLRCPPPVSLVAPQMCQTSDEMRHGITSPTGIILWSALILQSVKVSVLVRCGENDNGGYCDNSGTKKKKEKSTPSQILMMRGADRGERCGLKQNNPPTTKNKKY